MEIDVEGKCKDGKIRLDEGIGRTAQAEEKNMEGGKETNRKNNGVMKKEERWREPCMEDKEKMYEGLNRSKRS